jgi:hypothetical protein
MNRRRNVVRRISTAVACIVGFAATAAGQSLSLHAIRASVERETLRLAAIERSRTDARDVEGSAAQPARSFEELAALVKTGDIVYVIDTSGEETRGRIAALTAASLVLSGDGTRQDFVPGAVSRIERRQRDSVRNGLLLGLATGSGLGYSIGKTADSPSCPRSGVECGQGALIGTAGGAFWGGVGGWIADALIHRREVIYVR